MDATVVIPVKNGGELLDQVLARVFEQKTEYTYEVICVDSGSTDGSLETMKKYPCKVYSIEPEEFGHGKTRNYGASKGTGEFILFLTQDALPADDLWLQNFIDAMKTDPQIAGGFGKHIPYPECNELDKRDIPLHFKGFGEKNTIYQLTDYERYQREEGYRHFLVFYTDNNSCMRRSVWEKYPYDDVDFAEDQIWARKMIEMGKKKLYCAEAVVYHSHNYPLKTYFRRYYDEYKGLYLLHEYRMSKSFSEAHKLRRSLCKNDIAYIKNSADITDKKKWIHYAKKRNKYRCRAGYLGGLYYSLPTIVQELLDARISQQKQQIYGNGKKMKRKGKLNKEFWKWVFLNPNKTLEEKTSIQIDTRPDVCEFYDFVMKKPKVPFSWHDYEKQKNGQKNINWVIPEMGAGSGGHINIFRFVNGLQQRGYSNKLYVINCVNFHSDEEITAFVHKHFDLSSDVEIHVGAKDMQFAHATIATSWITAYCVRDFDNTISKFYFVQDFEPLFYAAGSEYSFAENTYKLGFRGITAGDWLKNKLHDEYGMQTGSYKFSYDKNLYVPGEKRDTTKRVFFYARPVTARRDFEIGLLALNKLAGKIPDLEVAFAGWDIGSYKINFSHADFGVVKLEELSDLYAQCDLCLVLSHTNLSLLPLEIMASNSVAVCSRGENSTWLVTEENAVMVDYDADQIADKMEYYLTNPSELAKIREKGLAFARNTSWETEINKVIELIKNGIDEDEKERVYAGTNCDIDKE